MQIHALQLHAQKFLSEFCQIQPNQNQILFSQGFYLRRNSICCSIYQKYLITIRSWFAIRRFRNIFYTFTTSIKSNLRFNTPLYIKCWCFVIYRPLYQANVRCNTRYYFLNLFLSPITTSYNFFVVNL